MKLFEFVLYLVTLSSAIIAVIAVSIYAFIKEYP